MGTDYDIKRLRKKSGVAAALFLKMYGWLPSKDGVKEVSAGKVILAYLYITKILPLWDNFITLVTHFYPFSLFFRESLLHANNIKFRDLMREMESIALKAKIPVYINKGHNDREFIVFYGKLERGGINKKKAIETLQQLFREKYGGVYVQDEKIGFRVLVDTSSLWP